MVSFGFFTLPLIILLTGSQCYAEGTMDVRDFFPELGNDMTKVTWVHRCNSRAMLESALSSDVMMIEADIVSGHLVSLSDGDAIPIMGHPPEKTSDLSLEQFLDLVLNRKSRKGIKLDFKTIEIFKASENVLEDFLNRAVVDFPVWINADIIKGPGHPAGKEVVEANYFLQTCVKKFSYAMISAGWSVDPKDAQKLEYNATHISDMTSALSDNGAVYPVTFAVHAGIASKSEESLTGLIKTAAHGSSLTLWAGVGEWVDYTSLKKLIENIGRDKIFIDIPQDMKAKLQLDSTMQSKAAHVTLSVFALVFIGLLFIY